MPEDAVKIAPHAYKVIEENDRVRILESRMVPGEKTEMHGHPDLVTSAIKDGKFKFAGPDGQSFEEELKIGQAMFFPGTEHSTENTGAAEGHVILVELK